MNYLKILPLLTFLVAVSYFIYLLLRTYLSSKSARGTKLATLSEQKANNTTGSITVWAGVVIMAASQILPGIRSTFNAFVGVCGFVVIVCGFYLNHRNAASRK